MNNLQNTPQYAIHLGVDCDEMSRLESNARLRDATIIRLDLSGITDRRALVEYLAETFRFPTKVVGVDAALDMLSDLDWINNRNGYLVVVRGGTAATEVGEVFASMLPNIIDRWRSRGVSFLVAIDDDGRRLGSALRTANRDMSRAGRLPWAQPGTGPVDVVVH